MNPVLMKVSFFISEQSKKATTFIRSIRPDKINDDVQRIKNNFPNAFGFDVRELTESEVENVKNGYAYNR